MHMAWENRPWEQGKWVLSDSLLILIDQFIRLSVPLVSLQHTCTHLSRAFRSVRSGARNEQTNRNKSQYSNKSIQFDKMCLLMQLTSSRSRLVENSSYVTFVDVDIVAIYQTVLFRALGLVTGHVSRNRGY